MKITFEETHADFFRNVDLHIQETLMNFNVKLNRLSLKKMMYILWFPTEGHFILLKRQEILPE